MRLLIIALSLLTCSCALSLTPGQFAEQFPAKTTSQYYTQVNGQEAISSGQCKIIIKDRKYNAPVGTTLKDDMNNGARGLDEWVQIDGGNAYILNNFEWIYLDADANGNRATQLILYFDTMNCK